MEKKEQSEMEEQRKECQSAEEVAQDYSCNRVCRLCPYPGLKCTPDHETFTRIQ